MSPLKMVVYMDRNMQGQVFKVFLSVLNINPYPATVEKMVSS